MPSIKLKSAIPDSLGSQQIVVGEPRDCGRNKDQIGDAGMVPLVVTGSGPNVANRVVLNVLSAYDGELGSPVGGGVVI